MKRVRMIMKPTGRKPMRIGTLLLKEVPYKNEWRIQATWRDPDRRKQWFNNWRHAEEFATKTSKRLDELKEKGAGRYTGNDAFDSYIKDRERHSKAKDNAGCTLDTFESVQRIIESHLRPKFGRMRLDEITTRLVSDWLIEHAETAKPRTLKFRLDVLNRVLNYAAEREMVRVNPLKQKQPKIPGKIEKRAKIPDRSDLDVLRDYLNGPRPLKLTRFRWSCARMVVLLALSAGLRAGEACALQWDDIDPDTGEITINKTRARLQGLKRPKTEAGNRRIPTTHAARTIINEHAEVYKQFYGKCVGPVLRGSKHEKNYLHPHSLSRIFRDVMHDCDLVDPDTNQIKFTYHAGRHWCASHWLKSMKGDIHQTSKWMGHQNASMTLDVYGHVLDDPEARANFERMPDWLIAPIQVDSLSAPQTVEITEPLRALPAPENSFEFDPKANGQAEPDCPIDVLDIAEPWVKPLIRLLHQGVPIREAYHDITPLLPDLKRTKNPQPLTIAGVNKRVVIEFRRLKLPIPDVMATRFRAEKILRLHGQKYQTLDIARLVGCHPATVNRVLRDRHKPNAHNPLNQKIFNPRPNARKSQPEHKTQLKLL